MMLPQEKNAGTWSILVIDNEEAMHDSCRQVLSREGYTIFTAFDGDHGMRYVRENRPDLVILDLMLPGKSGKNLLQEITLIDPTIVMVVITGYATIESAVEAMKLGASDFLPKPFTPDELRVIVKRGLEKRDLLVKTRKLEDENIRLRENFVTIITHEMRTPLVAVEQYIEVLLGNIAGELQEKQREILTQGRRRIQWLLSLVNEWLSMARIQNTILQEKFEKVSIPEILDEAMDVVRIQAEEKNISLVSEAPDDLPVLTGNREALIHLFMNLYSNAIKYNREFGSVKSSVHDEGDFVTVKIADTGIGIPQESLPFIFDEFFRVRAKGSESIKASGETGTGLGLAIVRKIVDVHKGYVTVESEVDIGTTMTVYLPKRQLVQKENDCCKNGAHA